jgi:hypothetical protein
MFSQKSFNFKIIIIFIIIQITSREYTISVFIINHFHLSSQKTFSYEAVSTTRNFCRPKDRSFVNAVKRVVDVPYSLMF